MRILHANTFVQNWGMGDPTTCFHQLLYNGNDNDGKEIIQYFIMHELGLCIKVDSYLAHIFYACLFSHDIEVPIYINKSNIFFPKINTLMYCLGELVIRIKIRLDNYIHLYDKT